jgi:uncharacterized protein YigA (DUF484 family)
MRVRPGAESVLAERSADGAEECLELWGVADHMVGELVCPAGFVLRKSFLESRREEVRVELAVMGPTFGQMEYHGRSKQASTVGSMACALAQLLYSATLILVSV